MIRFLTIASMQNQLVTTAKILTPLGSMLAGATDEGICLLEFIDTRTLDAQLAKLKQISTAEFVLGSNIHLNALQQQIEEYFSGTRKEFRLTLVIFGTAFQQKVWKGLCTIPYGTTCSYKEQAEMIGHPKAVRAVAKTNGDNRISIIIPCHRVIGSDGNLTGYGGGLWRKKFLIEHESKYLENKREGLHG